MVARDGGIFSFGDAPFYGSVPGKGLHVDDVVGMAPTPSGNGYWIARSGGEIYSFGDAKPFVDYIASMCDPVTAIFSNPKGAGLPSRHELGRDDPVRQGARRVTAHGRAGGVPAGNAYPGNDHAGGVRRRLHRHALRRRRDAHRWHRCARRGLQVRRLRRRVLQVERSRVVERADRVRERGRGLEGAGRSQPGFDLASGVPRHQSRT